jgi:hypothetical protein
MYLRNESSGREGMGSGGGRGSDWKGGGWRLAIFVIRDFGSGRAWTRAGQVMLGGPETNKICLKRIEEFNETEHRARFARALLRYGLPASENRGHDSGAAVAVHNRDYPQGSFIRRRGNPVLITDAEKYRKTVRIGSVATAVLYEGLYAMREAKRRQHQESRLAECCPQK